MGFLQDAEHILQRGAEGATHWCMRCQQYCGGKNEGTGDEIQCSCHGDGVQPEETKSGTGESDQATGTPTSQDQAPGEVTAPPPDSAGQPEPPATDEDKPGVPENAGVVTAVSGESRAPQE